MTVAPSANGGIARRFSVRNAKQRRARHIVVPPSAAIGLGQCSGPIIIGITSPRAVGFHRSHLDAGICARYAIERGNEVPAGLIIPASSARLVASAAGLYCVRGAVTRRSVARISTRNYAGQSEQENRGELGVYLALYTV